MEYTDLLANVASSAGVNAELDLSTLAQALDEYLNTGQIDIIDDEIHELTEGIFEDDFAKCIAGAIKIFNTINNIEEDDITVAAQAQQAATLVNGVIEIASGEMTIDDLIEKVVDMSECRLVANLDITIDLGIEALPAIVGAVYPPLAPIATVIQPFLRQLAPEIKETAGKVVHSLGNFVKNVAKEGVQTVKEIAKTLLS